ncbi:YceK/YidQ family lipoprotein [Pseudomonas tussilaginis]|uniref:YceK/YidQ family lipoprotein n=1 Tax=unclassified Pseudomonas TaxID=196821 RepID=UPI000C6DFDE8|nr:MULTISPECIES: YceK/YidQ family lipoprotein [unclassified Pseudomonas]QYX48318.1 YceK/YidQ family lipoprotein [Pseudomonas sp. S11A 273]
MKAIGSLLIVISLTGCGTINTVFRDDSVASSKLAHWQSHCDSIPRIYSGAALDFCALHAEPRRTVGSTGQPSAVLMMVDLVLSGVADTVALPYTIYAQQRDGDIPKTWLK